MKSFDPIIPNKKLCEKELEEFRALLDNPEKELSENEDLLPLFYKSHQLISLLGTFHPGISEANLIAYEFDLDDFICDFVVGDKRRDAFCFVEFEDAKRYSIFKKKQRHVKEWGPRFEHGFSQLVDWIYKIYKVEHSAEEFEEKFNTKIKDFMSLLVIGRDSFLSQSDQNRLQWRCRSVVVNSQQIR